MNREEFQDALRKGLGRAIQHVRNSPPEVVREDLLHACLNSLAVDQQIEGNRAPWLFFMLDQTDDMNYYGPRIFERYFDLVQDEIRNDTEYQLFGLICEFATEYGNKKAKTEVYRFFDRQFEPEYFDGWFNGKFAIMQMDGIPGLFYVLERIGRYIKDNNIDYDEGSFSGLYIIEDAERLYGKEEVQAALKVEAEQNEFIRIYLEWEKAHLEFNDARNSEYQNETNEEKGKRNRVKYPLREMVDQFLADDFSNYQNEEKFVKNPVRFFRSLLSSSPYKFMTAGMWAEENDLEHAYQKMCETDDLVRKTVLLKTFEYRPLLKVEPQLIALLDSDNKELAKSVRDALSNTKHLFIREKALAMLRANPIPPNWFDGLALLENNFQVEDIPTILSSLQANRIADGDVLHDIVSYLRKMDDNNPSDAFAPILLWMYENCPCSECRQDVVERLLEMNRLPVEIREECRDDCNPDIRELVDAQT